MPDTGLANRDAEFWHPLLSIAAHTGDDDLLAELRKHAQLRTADDADDRSPDADPAFIRALWELRKGFGFPTANEVLERARENEPGSFATYSPKGVSTLLGNYQISTKPSHGRRVFKTDVAFIERVADAYGFDFEELGDENDGE